jgi:glycosyltransferase involved in cell wall biosynthesis
MPGRELDISVVICCYNSSGRLAPTIKHLAEQEFNSEIKWEVVIVDNASTDDTNEYALNELSKYQFESKVVYESEAGLSNARKKGVKESSGRYILFCDDDNWLDKRYFQLSYDIMESDPKIGMLGGFGEPYIEGLKPKWFDRYQVTYAVGPQHHEEADISYIKAYVYGAGSVVRKELLLLLDKIGFKHVLTDRIGKKMVSGGDNEIGYAMVLLGYKVYYSPRLKFEHYIPQGRLTKEYLLKIYIAQVLTTPVVKAYEQFIFDKTLRYWQIGVQNAIIDAKKIIKLNLKWLKKEVDDLDHYLRIRRLAAQIKYSLLNKGLHASNFQKVKRNIELIQRFVSNAD